jgi:hypothetical protein
VSTTFQGPSVTPSTGSIASPKGASAIGGARRPFPFGEVIRPENDLLGRDEPESNREQLCIDKNTFKILTGLYRPLTHKLWKMGRWVHCRRQPSDVLRVMSTNYGWRVLGRVPSKRSCRRALGHVLAKPPLLFPTAEVAITAAELVFEGRPEELWHLDWL